jgi:8-oxo-dGTP pyrophosphatase MutT (NUDIX family)
MFSDDIKFTQKIVLLHPEKSNSFLILTRSMDARTRPGALDLPGGNVLCGEEAEESIRREVEEETGITNLPRPEIIHLHTKMRPEKEYYLIATGYKVQLESKHLEQIKLSNEHTNHQWMTEEEFLQTNPQWFLREFVEIL